MNGLGEVLLTATYADGFITALIDWDRNDATYIELHITGPDGPRIQLTGSTPGTVEVPVFANGRYRLQAAVTFSGGYRRLSPVRDTIVTDMPAIGRRSTDLGTVIITGVEETPAGFDVTIAYSGFRVPITRSQLRVSGPMPPMVVPFNTAGSPAQVSIAAAAAGDYTMVAVMRDLFGPIRASLAFGVTR